MQTLKLAENIFDELKHGKLTTIRLGRRDIELGNLLFESVDRGRVQYVYVTSVRYCKLEDVNAEELNNDGFRSHADMINVMMVFYPSIQLKDEVTIISFKH